MENNLVEDFKLKINTLVYFNNKIKLWVENARFLDTGNNICRNHWEIYYNVIFSESVHDKIKSLLEEFDITLDIPSYVGDDYDGEVIEYSEALNSIVELLKVDIKI